MTAIRVDIHPHVISPDTGKYPLAPVGGKRSAWSASSHSLTPGQLVNAMAALSFLSEDDLDLVMGGTAAWLYPALADAA